MLLRQKRVKRGTPMNLHKRASRAKDFLLKNVEFGLGSTTGRIQIKITIGFE